MSKHDKWYVQINGRTHGPFTSQQLRVQAASGRVTPSTKLRPGKDGDWVEAIKVKGLFPKQPRVEPARAQSSRPLDKFTDPVTEPPSSSEQPAAEPSGDSDQPPANPDSAGHSHGAAAIVLGVMATIAVAIPLLGLTLAALGSRVGHRGRRIAALANVEPSGLIFAGRWICWIAGALAAVVTFTWVVVLIVMSASTSDTRPEQPPAIERQLREDW